MAIPDEDLGPAWLRDTQYIQADINAMADFATKLRAEVELNYAPHLPYIQEDALVPLPEPPAGFPELVDLLTTHHVTQSTAYYSVHDHANATGAMASAANDVSKAYSGSDAFSAATVGRVDRALRDNGAPTPPAEQPPAAPTGDR